ncbi:MAG TPA: MBL fold metallo-hydrolase [Gammaproteobacteria bacterium]|nr:MBL fold metallo-hydrolase [Gammaproteobacteria bacterium]
MKQLHRPDLFGWSVFDPDRNIDFHSVVWLRDKGNVVIDPLPLSDHDRGHLDSVGGAAFIVVTNSDHSRDAARLSEATGAELLGPAGERDGFPLKCARWLEDGDVIVEGMNAYALNGSKTPGELALVLEGRTLITGDLIRAHEGGRLRLIPEAKLENKARAIESVKRIASMGPFDAVLPGDGWPVFRDAQQVLDELVASLEG